MPFFALGPEGRKQFEQFGRASTLGLELGLSIALGFWGGRWLDRKFGTGGWFTWIGFGLGLAAGTRSLYSLVRRTQTELSQDTSNDDTSNDDTSNDDTSNDDDSPQSDDSSDPDPQPPRPL